MIGKIKEKVKEKTESYLLIKNPPEEPIYVDRPQMFAIKTLPLVIGRLAGDWGQGKTTICSSIAYEAIKSGDFYATYVRFSGLGSETGELNLQRPFESFWASYGLKSPIKTGYGINYDRLISLLLPMIVLPNELTKYYDLKTGILTNAPRNMVLEGFEKKLLTGNYLDVLKTVGLHLYKDYVVLFDELESLQELDFDRYSNDLQRLFYDFRMLYDAWGRLAKIKLVFSLPNIHAGKLEDIINDLKMREDFARAAGIIYPQIDVVAFTTEEVREYLRKVEKYVFNKIGILTEEALNEIFRILRPIRVTRIMIALAREIFFSALEQALAENNISEIESTDAIKNLKIEIKKEHVIKSLHLPEWYSRLINNKYTDLIKNATLMLNKLAEDIAKELGERDVITLKSVTRSRGFVCSALVINYRSRNALEIRLWFRGTRFTSRISSDSIKRKLLLPERGKPSRNTKILLLHPIEIPPYRAVSVDPSIIRPVELTKDELLSLAVGTKILSGLGAPEGEIANFYRHHFLPRLVEEVRRAKHVG